MGRRKREPMNPAKKNIVSELIKTYDIKTAKDIQEALKDLLGETIQDMLEAEMNEHLGYEKYSRDEDVENSRNGYKSKKVRSSIEEFEIDVPQDRESQFEPKVIKKRQRDISEIEQKIINMYASGLTTKTIVEEIEDIYGFEVSESMISDITDKVIPRIEKWKSRPLDSVYPVIYIDAVHFSVKDDGIVKKRAAYVILGVTTEGMKQVLGLYVGDADSSKYWLSAFNKLKNKGLKDIIILCADGLTGIKESISVAFPKTEYQRCIVHQVRNTLKYVSYKDKKEFAANLKSIYLSGNEEQARQNLDAVSEKWSEKYPNALKSWYTNWDRIIPIFKFSPETRRVIYTTNAIESLNAQFKRLNRNRSVFPTKSSLEKALFLSVEKISKKWTHPIRNLGFIFGKLSIMFEERISY